MGLKTIDRMRFAICEWTGNGPLGCGCVGGKGKELPGSHRLSMPEIRNALKC